ncbi:hypothetical protein CHS0354_028977 [Potamilus streckersoni]|uniref:B-cell lymphoma 9 beta-catenin binding domain-containing protein n=1 Tax=Potamilus streckersoni TaxID=2493646 RepID=A0AAE0W8Y7_9BIVA|nr:hypothetical protein CHS0354_028977 [Potamilus streckersoni]
MMLPGKENLTHEMNGNSVKLEPITEVKEELSEEGQNCVTIKSEPGNPGSVGNNNKMSNGDTTGMELDTKLKTEDSHVKMTQQKQQKENSKVKDEPNRSPATSAAPNTPRNTTQVASQQPPSSTSHAPMPSGQQCMPNQAPSSMDPHFMQQQSQIFVFTTGMANEAADAVQSGQYKSILSYHMDQPPTKKFLQKNPPKMRGSGMPMYNMSNMRNNKMDPMNNQVIGGFGPSSANSVAQWVQQQNQNLQEQGYHIPSFPGNSPNSGMMYGPQNPGGNFPMLPDGSFFDPDMIGLNGPMGYPNMNLLQNKVPNENLTPEQLQRREEQLANLRKIQQMLFPEQRQHGQQFPTGPGPGPIPGPGPGMMPGDMPPGMYEQSMMASKRAMMMSQQAMTSQHNMMDSQRQSMMSSQETYMMSQSMSQFGHGPHPQSMQNLTPAQREWMRMQQDFYSEKRRFQPSPLGPQMGPGIDPQGPSQGQPPPPYSSSIAQKHQNAMGMGSPTSPTLNGPLRSPNMPAQGPDPTMDPIFPPHQRRPSFSPLDPSMGGMGPGMPPCVGNYDQGIMSGPQGSPMHPSMGQVMNVGGNMPSGKKNSQAHLQRAGNPEQYQPDVPLATSTTKPPPSYAQSQSNKRKREDIEELCKNLQPTPSPHPISYINQFEGQELTITKQINTAYREHSSNETQSNPYTPQNQIPHSPMHGPNSNKGPMSNSSQTSSGPLSSPGPMPGPGPSPLSASGASMRLSHYDPIPSTCGSIANSPTASVSKPSMSNITSATLANLAKGVENLSNQMQQHMMQGGPFHSIQMQGHGNNSNNNGNNINNSQSSAANQTSHSSHAIPASTQTQSTPSVNNTYVNATMSIQQLNIQSVHGGGSAPGQNFNASMQNQQMLMDQTQMSGMHSSAGGLPPGVHDNGPMISSASMSQQSMMGNMVHPGMNKMPSYSNPQSSQMAGPVSSMMQQSTGRMASPNYQVSSVGNANVQIQPKAPNTIQYLPANPPANQPSMTQMPNKKQDLDFMNRFSSPMNSMEGKGPSSKYNFPGQPTSPMMSPGPGPVMGPVTGPHIVTGMGMGPGPESNSHYTGPPVQGPGMQQAMMMRRDSPGLPMCGSMTALSSMANSGPMSMGMNSPMTSRSTMSGMGSPGPMSMSMTNPMTSMSDPRTSMSSMSGMSSMRSSDPLSHMMGVPVGPPDMGPSPGSMSNMNSMAANIPYNSPYPGSSQAMMSHGPGSHLQMQGAGLRMAGSGPAMNNMPIQGPYSRQPSPGIRMSGPGSAGSGMGPLSPTNPGYSAQYQQFQQQLYSQGRQRQMSQMDSFMGNPITGHIMGPGHSPHYMGSMMPNIPGPM